MGKETKKPSPLPAWECDFRSNTREESAACVVWEYGRQHPQLKVDVLAWREFDEQARTRPRLADELGEASAGESGAPMEEEIRDLLESLGQEKSDEVKQFVRRIVESKQTMIKSNVAELAFQAEVGKAAFRLVRFLEKKIREFQDEFLALSVEPTTEPAATGALRHKSAPAFLHRFARFLYESPDFPGRAWRQLSLAERRAAVGRFTAITEVPKLRVWSYHEHLATAGLARHDFDPSGSEYIMAIDWEAPKAELVRGFTEFLKQHPADKTGRATVIGQPPPTQLKWLSAWRLHEHYGDTSVAIRRLGALYPFMANYSASSLATVENKAKTLMAALFTDYP